MKMQLLALLCVGLWTPAVSENVSPIGKVLQMISDLQAKVIAEGSQTQKAYDEFSEWCEDRSKDFAFEIKTGKGQVEELTATIDDATQKTSALQTKVDELAASIATDEADLKAAAGVRAKENADFVAEEKELNELISMLERAVVVLEREMAKGGAAMLQTKTTEGLVQALSTMVQAAGFSSVDASKLTALVQSSQESDDTDLEPGAPAAAVYESHSGGIVDTLQGLLDKAQSQLSDARSKETSALQNFEMLKQSLEDSLKFGNKDMDAAKSGIAARSEEKAIATGDLDVTTKDLKEDEKSLADLHHECMTKAEDFEAETKSRDEELAALANAKKIISETTSGAAEQSYALLQMSRSRLAASADLANFEVVRFVRDLARKQKAPALAQLASRLASVVRMSSGSRDDVFEKVKGLISDMISKLEDEASQDATHKAFCDKELSETNAKNEDKNSEIAKLTAKIDQMSSRSAKLKDEVAVLQKELAQLANSQAEMDKMRADELALYSANKPEMEKGLEGIKLALKVLREYYSKGAGDHGTAEGAGDSIIGLLEVCESDFSKGLAEMIATEENAVAEYESQTKENEITKTTKDQDVKYKTKESTDLDKAVSDASTDRSGVQAELDAVLGYLKNLHGECDEVAETYAERKARRESELAGLKEAMEILGGQALIQRASHRVSRASFLHP